MISIWWNLDIPHWNIENIWVSLPLINGKLCMPPKMVATPVMSCHVSHAMLCYATYHVMSFQLLQCHVISHTMSHIMPHIMLHVISYSMSYHITCHFMSNITCLVTFMSYIKCHLTSCHMSYHMSYHISCVMSHITFFLLQYIEAVTGHVSRCHLCLLCINIVSHTFGTKPTPLFITINLLWVIRVIQHKRFILAYETVLPL